MSPYGPTIFNRILAGIGLWGVFSFILCINYLIFRTERWRSGSGYFLEIHTKQQLLRSIVFFALYVAAFTAISFFFWG